MRVLIIVLAVAQMLVAQSQPQSLSWAKLGDAVAGQQVTLVLSSGARLKGTIDRVLDDSVAMNVHSTSNSKPYPRGQASVPRKEVSEVRVRRVKGPSRAIFTAGFGAAGAFGLLPWAISENRVNVSDASRVASWAAITSGLTVAGYFVGRAIDTRETVITISPN